MAPHSNLVRAANILVLRAVYSCKRPSEHGITVTITICPLTKFTAWNVFRLLAVRDEPGISHCISTGRLFHSFRMITTLHQRYFWYRTFDCRNHVACPRSKRRCLCRSNIRCRDVSPPKYAAEYTDFVCNAPLARLHFLHCSVYIFCGGT
ncbi:hypothetical protein ARMGADRAFT_1016134 [Armillaria gallica]|uniref:Uncharacterized protein n=1 Tax=Armillaria gallica TaxID=47427 RepID=A0A2H3DH15_ARMGA|nr:hypothetical protein ARMGADRAFT_1016134 [Armillaria gallica]